jgi:hypothetical protein
MTTMREVRVPLLALPFVLIWRLITGIMRLVGRVLAFVMGVVLVIIGLLLSVTIIGAIVGLPMAAAGLLLMIRALF